MGQTMRKMMLLAISQSAPIMGFDNTLTAILPDLFAAMDTVSREQMGFIPSVMRAPGVERAAKGQSVSYPIAEGVEAQDIVPSMTIPEPPDRTVAVGQMAITKARTVSFGITGEEQRALNTGGVGFLSVQGMWIAEAFRTLANEIETDIAAEATRGASRAYGTPGTTPFGSGDLTDLAQIKKILDDNGAPKTGRSMILNSTASAKLITLGNLTKVNEAGTQMTLRDGELLNLYGMSIKETAQAVTHDAGTGAGATTDATGYAKGTTTITLAAAGTGTILAGDVVTFAGDTNKYVVVSGDADTSNGGTFTIAEPGLRVAIPAQATAITLANDYYANVGFSANAMAVALRPPAIPDGGDAASDRRLITDPRSGITFDIAIYKGYHKIRGEIGLAWGQKAVKPEHIGLLMG